MIRELSAYAQAPVTRRGSGDAAPVLQAIREARSVLRSAAPEAKPA
jgi:hypothetical protein